MDAAAYPHIGTDPRRLVVYFSRMGYVKKPALEEAERTGAAVYEIRSTERTEGTHDFGGAGVSACIDGTCRSNRSRSLFPPMSM